MNRLIILLIIFLPLLTNCRLESDYHNKNELIVCISFDDNCSSVYTTALPIMEEYGYRGTVFTNSGSVGRVSKLSWTQLESLLFDYNWEIGGHTLNHKHLATLTPSEAEFQVSADYDSLAAHNLNPVSFAYPFGECPVQYFPLVTKYYNNVRSIVNLPMYNPINRTRLGTYGVSNYMTPVFVTNRIMQATVEKENLVIYMFHDIVLGSDEYINSFSPEKFREFITRLHQMHVKVMPLNEALDYLDD